MRYLSSFFIGALFLGATISAEAQQAGSIRGTVYDKESDTPLAAAQVLIAETGAKATASDDGNFVFGQVPSGKYTLVFSKDGYTRQVAADVEVSEGQMKDVNASLVGEYTDMDEFVVQKLETGGGTEEGLLNLRMESPALMDSISSDMMSRAGASDAAGALRLVTGASVQDGKYAVVRGLPDRYVNSQMNGVRLPSADADKRAVQLDQFPTELIESIQVSKTFTPDQQGDASGGAVNVVLKGIPDATVLKVSVGTEYNTQTPGDGEFLTYKGGGVDFTGLDGGRDMQTPGTDWDGAVGVSRGDPPPAYNWSLTAGGKKEVLDGLKVGGLGNFYYKQKTSSYDNGIDDSYWLNGPGRVMTPQTKQGAPSSTGIESGDSFKTALFDVSQGSEEVQWGGLGAVGLETENNKLTLLYMRTQSTEDTATLAEDTRGKKYFVTSQVPGYDPNAPYDGYQDAAPYLRNETLEYVERKTDTLQLRGDHTLPFPETGIPGYFVLLPPEIDWTVAQSFSGLDSPDKRMFGSLWKPGTPDTVWGSTTYPGVPAGYYQNKGEAAYTLGNLQRIWKDISEDSEQYFVNGKIPFEQWSGDKGYLKTGIFHDKVEREYNQDSFSNFNTPGSGNQDEGPALPWNEYWSSVFPSEGHEISAAEIDVDYKAEQKISAAYYMLDIPLCPYFKVLGGQRIEKTDLSIVLDPESQVFTPTGNGGSAYLQPGEGDVAVKQQDILPALGFELKPHDKLTIRASYSETIARQTFKEMTPIQQMEYLGGDVFIGNPDLTMSAVKNYDLRADYTPFEGSLVSAAWFKKEIKNPIEYVQSYAVNIGSYTTPVNYPEGELTGYELEVRQQLGRFWDPLQGLAIGANATFIQSQVTLSDNESAMLESFGYPEETRDMMNAPAYLYNLNLTYDIEKTGTQLGLFYTVQGDTLVAGSGVSQGYMPSVYAKEYGTLNFGVSQKIGEHWKVNLKAKNLLDPEIQEVYRSDYIKDDTVKTSYTKGIEYSISASYEF